MADSWEENRNAAPSKDQDALLNGTDFEKVNTWLKITSDASGRPKAGEWMSTLIPHLALVSTDATGPHPSCTFSYTVQPGNCNRLDNLHGGCAATLFDYCTTLPLALVNRPGFWQFMGVSRTLNVTYMRPVPAGVEVIIETEIVQVGKKLATLRGTMRRKSDKALVAVCEHGKVNIDADLKKPKL
ncbi:HotDog domain-containing protein [Thelonectria olida]|uniref:HotDog domain-containing protein n=1 Tax=Thelonectria olida TaxID=1576542 RepID=A0A9P9AU33_9HYPO|nr:HotDog domain-containing protein [Thelonectria olida]